MHFYNLGRKLESSLSEQVREHEELLNALIERQAEHARKLIAEHIK
jgi:DNA-binding GntR family transcriptional regulator